MRKTYLLTPGPTAIPESIAAVFSQPIIHHRTPVFQKLFEEVRVGLKALFQTEQEVLLLAATGTGAMEASISNLFRKGDCVITINGGKFGERWTKLAKVYGLNPVELLVPWGEAIDPKKLEAATQAHPTARAILFQASETSTGAKMPTEEICKIAARAGMISICDAITACGVFDLPMDRWGIDVLITGSQKALMLPPGLAMIALSARAWKLNETADLPRFYFDLAKERKLMPKNQTAWTPAISIIQGLHESLRMIHEEGLENVFARHELLARATRAGIAALGLDFLARSAPSTAVTAVLVPPTVKDGKLIPKMLRDQYGITIAGGQDAYEGKIFRLSHFGFCDRFDITTALSGVELVLKELGHPLVFGTAVGAALQVFSSAGEK